MKNTPPTPNTTTTTLTVRAILSSNQRRERGKITKVNLKGLGIQLILKRKGGKNTEGQYNSNNSFNIEGLLSTVSIELP